MDDCYRNLSRIPVSNIAAGLNLTDMEAVFDSAKVMSEPIGHKSYKGKTENGEGLQIEDLEIFENVAYVMAYHADNSISANIEDWLDQFNMFSIYEVLPGTGDFHPGSGSAYDWAGSGYVDGKIQ